MNDDQDNLSTIRETADDFVDQALTFVPQSEPDEPRDSSWLRWSKFVSIIAVPAAAFGFLFFCEYYYEEYSYAKHFTSEAAAERIEGDPLRPMKQRIAIGATIGGGLGLIYVVRCLARDVDP
jgi:hypothetical protein